MTEKLKVRATSRLVLEASLPLYNTALQQQYIDAIDFSETSRLLYNMKLKFPLVTEVVKLRKQGIRYFLKEGLTQHHIQQVIILGAGLDPLSLYLLENFPQLRNIIEVDNGYLAEKKVIYDNILPEQTLIHFAPCDITDTTLLWNKLVQYGYNPVLPVIIVFEGVIHYITSEEFIRVMQLFQSTRHQNQVMLDYALALDEVPKAHQEVHESILQLLAANLPDPIQVYSRHQMNTLLHELHAVSVNREPLHITEKRSGSSAYFKADGEGIVELLDFYL